MSIRKLTESEGNLSSALVNFFDKREMRAVIEGDCRLIRKGFEDDCDTISRILVRTMREIVKEESGCSCEPEHIRLANEALAALDYFEASNTPEDLYRHIGVARAKPMDLMGE